MKIILIVALLLTVLGITALCFSGYFALAYYFGGDRVPTTTPKTTLDNKIDSDGDGLTDKQEIDIYHTDSHKKDTDGDGYSDKQEIDAGFDPLTPASK